MKKSSFKILAPLSILGSLFLSTTALSATLEESLSSMGAAMSSSARTVEGSRTAYRDIEIVFDKGSRISAPNAWWVEAEGVFTAEAVLIDTKDVSRGTLTSKTFRGSLDAMNAIFGGVDCSSEAYKTGGMTLSGVEITADADALATNQSPERIIIQSISMDISGVSEPCFLKGSVDFSRISAMTPSGLMNVRGLTVDAKLPLPGYKGLESSSLTAKIDTLALSTPDLRSPLLDMESMSFSSTFPSLNDVDLNPEAAINKIIAGPSGYTVDINGLKVSIEGDAPQNIIDSLEKNSGSRRLNAALSSTSTLKDGLLNTSTSLQFANIAEMKSRLVLSVENIPENALKSLQGGDMSNPPTIKLVMGSLSWRDISLSQIMKDVLGVGVADFVVAEMRSTLKGLPASARPFMMSFSDHVFEFLSRATQSRMQVSLRPEVPIDMITIGVLSITSPEQLGRLLGLTQGELK